MFTSQLFFTCLCSSKTNVPPFIAIDDVATALDDLHSTLLKVSQEEESSSGNGSNYGTEHHQSTDTMKQPSCDMDDGMVYASSEYADVSALWGDNYGGPGSGGGFNDTDGRNHAHSTEITPDFGNSSPTFLGSRGRAYSESAATAATSFQEINTWEISSKPYSSETHLSSSSYSSSALSTEDAAVSSTVPSFGFGEVAQPKVSLEAWDWQAPANSYGMHGSANGGGRLEGLVFEDDQQQHDVASTHWGSNGVGALDVTPFSLQGRGPLRLEPFVDDGASLHAPNQSSVPDENNSHERAEDHNYGFLPHM